MLCSKLCRVKLYSNVHIHIEQEIFKRAKALNRKAAKNNVSHAPPPHTILLMSYKSDFSASEKYLRYFRIQSLNNDNYYYILI